MLVSCWLLLLCDMNNASCFTALSGLHAVKGVYMGNNSTAVTFMDSSLLKSSARLLHSISGSSHHRAPRRRMCAATSAGVPVTCADHCI